MTLENGTRTVSSHAPRLVVQQTAVGKVRVFLVQLGEGRLHDLSLHFARATAFLLLDRDGGDVRARLREADAVASSPESAEAVRGLLDALGSYMSGHSSRVRRLSLDIAGALDLGELATRELGHAAALHDIGKILVPAHLLTTRNPLTGPQRRALERHVALGAEMLAALRFPAPLVRIVAAHHERMDGTGYPAGLSAEETPMASRIIAVADAFDVMTHPRTYGAMHSEFDALAELVRCAGWQFDPACVEALRAIRQPRPRLATIFDEASFALRDRPRPLAVPVAAAGAGRTLFRPSRAGVGAWSPVPAAS